MTSKFLLRRILVLIAAVLTVASLAPPTRAGAGPLKTLYRFCSGSGRNCTDGDGTNPAAGVIMDASGNLYGTTPEGGVHTGPIVGYGAGGVFELTPNPATGTWTETVLYDFCSQAKCTDGVFPSGLIMGASGNLYGTTFYGGSHDKGAVFELTRNAASGTWTETVLYSFCAQGLRKCPDGAYPSAGLITDASGNLYSTTRGGGAHQGGTVFELIPDAATGTWTETVLYSFCAQAPNCADGADPWVGVIMDASGNLYGTTVDGGAFHQSNDYTGTAFELTPNTATGIWTETVLHSFCSHYFKRRCVDGNFPGSLIMDVSGNLYGTATEGAHLAPNDYGAGDVFELTPNAATRTWAHKILHNFCSRSDCADGAFPSGLTMLATGNLYGTASGGGADDGGTVFVLTPNAAQHWGEKVLHNFCPRGSTFGCTAGAGPSGPLTIDASGNLYGTASGGGSHDHGTVFELR
jgi:uncharacterized repeat protein (TIGR03803 family)